MTTQMVVTTRGPTLPFHGIAEPRLKAFTVHFGRQPTCQRPQQRERRRDRDERSGECELR